MFQWIFCQLFVRKPRQGSKRVWSFFVIKIVVKNYYISQSGNINAVESKKIESQNKSDSSGQGPPGWFNNADSFEYFTHSFN